MAAKKKTKEKTPKKTRFLVDLAGEGLKPEEQDALQKALKTAVVTTLPGRPEEQVCVQPIVNNTTEHHPSSNK
ncbi:MAG: hypothetical protein ABSB23_13790 [Bryobacteraceae bacterium]|jgi:hypothetical protein